MTSIKPQTSKRSQARSFRPEEEFKQEIIDLARVTRVMAGGKRMRFRACVALGDSHGKVGVATAKGADVTLAINKAVARAKKNMVIVPLVNETIPYEVRQKFGAAKILIKPAPRGTGVKAGGSLRIIFELAGVKNVVGKILGSNNKINIVSAAIEAIKKLRLIDIPLQDEKKTVTKNLEIL